MALYIPRSIFHFVPLLYFRPETFGHTLVECLQLLAQKIILVTRNHKTNSTTHSSATNSSRSSRFLLLIASLTFLSISSNLACNKTNTVLQSHTDSFLSESVLCWNIRTGWGLNLVFGAAKQMLKAGMLTCYVLLFVGTCRHFGGTYLSNCMTSPSICIILIIYTIFYIIIIYLWRTAP